VEVIVMGFIVVDVIVKDKIKKLIIKDVFHVSNLQAKLLMVSKVLSRGLRMEFTYNKCIVKSVQGEVVAMARC